MDEIKANVPNAADCWDFAFGNGIGVTWAFGQYAYVYRTDLVDPAPTDFKAFWEDRFAGNRATYIAVQLPADGVLHDRQRRLGRRAEGHGGRL